MLEAKLRDLKKKGKVLRNSGLVTGTIKRKNGETSLISMVSHKLETYILRNGLNATMKVNLEGNVIDTKIRRAQKDIVLHNIINIDLIEI
ncbi:hypothetical protein PMY56_05565 [Clostridium tertium]|jgi:ribosomal protein L25 (general stress protein Ctc)|uniref:Large ribosomal subunit protein bL25 L25 domain-containing protein n=2 Tax=Clostridium tertium TaxID=1559 RepID=A0A9X4B3P4_9CLOT|nr:MULTISPECIES: hypothetical protein [Clostridium]EEH98833.2 hypothetical protein CSBG_02459 [Clostridium sp. 7_2_43FAA]MBP1869545.1 ribosomal protein L25 (general stress protein Ctc) [Clostridium tertium]MBS5305820.1 hypothetical protein [Clostridium sp.]MBS5885984.1 hypothetical protein [Clostridium sp.]MBS6502430.1 hypothetical protein [Clostridium sp.]